MQMSRFPRVHEIGVNEHTIQEQDLSPMRFSNYSENIVQARGTGENSA